MKKRIIATVLIVLQIMLIASSCTQENEPAKQGQSVKSVGEISNKTTVFSQEMIPLPGERTYSGTLSYADGEFSFLGNTPNGYYLYSFGENEKNGVTDSAPFPAGKFSEGTLEGCQMLSGNRYMYAEGISDGAGNYTDMKITFSSSDDGDLFSVTADSLLGAGAYLSSLNNFNGFFSVKGASSFGDDEYLLVTSLGLFILDSSGSVKSSILPEGTCILSKFAVTSSDEIVVLQQDLTSGTAKLSFADMDEGKLSDFTGDITKYVTWRTHLAAGNGKYTLYFTGGNSLYGVSTDKNTSDTPIEVVNLIDSSVNPSDINSFESVSDEKFVVSVRNQSFSTELYMLTMTPNSKLVQKTPIVLAHDVSTFPYNQEVMDFNNNSDTYKIVYKDYSMYNDIQNGDYTSGMQIMTNEIIAGDIPDIVYFNSPLTSTFYNNLMRKGVFTDLYPFFDNDADVSRDTVVPFILEPFETDGKLYQLVTYYSASTYMAERADIPYDTWSYEKMFELMDSLDDNTVITNWNLLSSAQIGSDREITGYLLSDSTSDFIDYENATVSFGSDAFIRILEKLKEGYEKREKLVTSGSEYRAVIASIGTGSFDSYIQLLYAPWWNTTHYDDPIFMPPPSTEERSISDAPSVIISSNVLCITESSKNKDSAWEFLKYLMSEEVQDLEAMWASGVTPINQNSFDKYMDECTSLYYYFADRNRTQVKNIGKFDPSVYEVFGKDGVEVKVTQELVDTYKKLLYNAKGKQEHDYALHGILLDEILPFMYGENSKTAEETAKAIQSRASIFISEIN